MNEIPAIKSANDEHYYANVEYLNAQRSCDLTRIAKANVALRVAIIRVDLAKWEHLVLPRRIEAAQHVDATALEADDLFDAEARIASLKNDIAYHLKG
jgi:hypothetical protein